MLRLYFSAILLPLFLLIASASSHSNNNGNNNNDRKLSRHPFLLIPRGGGGGTEDKYNTYKRDITNSQKQYEGTVKELESWLDRTKALNKNATRGCSHIDMDVIRLSIPIHFLPEELVYPTLFPLYEQLEGLQGLARNMQERLQDHQTVLEDCLVLTKQCLVSIEDKKSRISKFLRRKHRFTQRKVRKWETKFVDDMSALNNAKESLSHKLQCRYDTWNRFLQEARGVQEKAKNVQELVDVMRQRKREQEERRRKREEERGKMSSTTKVDIDNFYDGVDGEDSDDTSMEVEISTYTFHSHY